MIHVVGTIGMLLVLGAYALVSLRRIAAASVAFQGLNLVGAGFLAAYSLALGAWATVALNVVWALIALAALVRVRSAAPDGA